MKDVQFKESANKKNISVIISDHWTGEKATLVITREELVKALEPVIKNAMK